MPVTRLPHKAYKMLVHMHERNRNTWASSICFILYRYGYEEEWENQGVGNERVFLTNFKDSLVEQYKSDWSSGLQSSERYCLYSTY